MELTSIAIDDEPQALAEIGELLSLTPGINLRATFNNVNDAIHNLQEFGPVDIVFCDISMPVTDGIKGAKMLKVYCDHLVYITAHRNYAEEAFHEGASGYLVKPINHERLIEKVEQLKETQEKNRRIEYSEKKFAFITGKTKHSFIQVFYSEIIYFEALLNHIKIITTRNTEITYIGLKQLERDLMRHPDFIRIGKSHMISINYLKKVEGNMAFMSNGECLSVGEKYRNAFTAILRKGMLSGG
ncbi:LytTR family DNA-binding domain-containing protein [Pedobacter sp. KBS0701]|uniref:LytR/AlgR family response regulator transcription factor n=1 Tax=Pedobacter sp. KBS0701 TaxID=2578106 RepID=UPI00143D6D73|nr:LytTR family DNA-binding domain-containing protein [Pedobacter sp. KBS0701]